MQPIWARKFEPPAVSGDESQEVIETLMHVSQATGDRRYLEPIPRALAYVKRSLLPDGRLARYYELETNKPLYMVRNGDEYALTYDDSRLPAHYGWKSESRLGELQDRYDVLTRGGSTAKLDVTDAEARRIIAALDGRGRWVSSYGGERLVGQPKFQLGAKYLSSEVFSRHLIALSEFVRAKSGAAPRGD
jgi:hypothetical protein